MWLQVLLSSLAGALTGFMSGVLGIGGGVIVVPALLFIFEGIPMIPTSSSMHFAAGSSLAVMLFTSAATIFAHCRIEPILWWVYRRMGMWIIVGTILGALLSAKLSTSMLKGLFAIFLFFVAYKMSNRVDPKAALALSFPSPWITRLASTGIGILSGLLGVGGGILMIPYLTYCGIDSRRIAPISSLCTMTVAAIGTVMFSVTASEPFHLAFTTGYIYWPVVCWVALASVLFAPVGAKLSYQLSPQAIRRIFVVVLCITSVGLFL